MMKKRRRSKKRGPQHYTYYFKVLDWHAHCYNTYEWTIVRERDADESPWERQEIRETKVENRHYIDLKVELLNPVKKVVGGDIDICTARKVEMKTDFYPKHIQYELRPQDDGGGALWSRWDKDNGHRITTGLAYVDECSYLALLQLLIAGRPVIAELGGEEYYRNTARIREVGWFTEGDPEKDEEVRWAIEQAS